MAASSVHAPPYQDDDDPHAGARPIMTLLETGASDELVLARIAVAPHEAADFVRVILDGESMKMLPLHY
eukprot:6123368-Prymnesium_polylepis.1